MPLKTLNSDPLEKVMPFQSKAQERWMFAKKPEMAKEWASHTDQSKLPERKKKPKKGMLGSK